MNSTVSSFTVFFEGPFWVGVYERFTDAGLEACKVTFGSEPKDYEVYAFMLCNWGRLRFGQIGRASWREGVWLMV